MSGPVGRFAPSPSGRLHLGNLACSLLAWLSARSRGGRIVLRIEDLDAARCPRVYADQLEEDLRWLGLDWDEGGSRGGPHGPYYQSECAEIYTESYKKLDATRIIPPTSGGKIYLSELYDFRLYEPDCEVLKAMLYIRTNGGIYGEKEEARMLKADGALLASADLRKLAAYVGSFSAGRVTKNDYLTEKSFIDTYASAYDIIAASGAIGFTLSDLVDTGKGGILDAERNFLLSREGLTKLIAVNKKKAFAES